MTQPPPPPMPDDPPAGRQDAPARRPRRRWLRGSVAGMMVLVAIVAVGLAAFERSRRLRIVIDNTSPGTILTVTVTHAGHQFTLGPIGPNTSQEGRLATDRVGTIAVSGRFDPSPAIRYPEFENQSRSEWGYGWTIIFRYDGVGTTYETRR